MMTWEMIHGFCFQMTAQIIEVPINAWIKESLSGCSGCMTIIYECGH
jgi:hypothetical protein